MKILLGVTGGIAAYKSCEFCSLAIKEGHEVKVVMTQNAQRFVGAITFEGLTNHKVLLNTFESAMDHIYWAKWADIVVVAPLSANSLAKIAIGLCDDLLSTTICAIPSSTPILLCPAMNTEMWHNTITKRNLTWLKDAARFNILEPIEKRLACGDVGVGALVDPEEILKECNSLCH